MARKATKGQIEKRISIITELTLACVSYAEILQYSADNWQVSIRQTDIYIKRAKERIQKEAKSRLSDGIDARIMMLYADRKNALKAGDKRLAFNILTKICELAGDFNHAQNLNIDNNVSGNLTIGIEPIDTDYRNAIEPLAPKDYE